MCKYLCGIPGKRFQSTFKRLGPTSDYIPDWVGLGCIVLCIQMCSLQFVHHHTQPKTHTSLSRAPRLELVSLATIAARRPPHMFIMRINKRTQPHVARRPACRTIYVFNPSSHRFQEPTLKAFLELETNRLTGGPTERPTKLNETTIHRHYAMFLFRCHHT